MWYRTSRQLSYFLVLLFIATTGLRPMPAKASSQPATLNSSVCGSITTATASTGGAYITILVPSNNTPIAKWADGAAGPDEIFRIFDPQIVPLNPPFDSQEYGLIQYQIAGRSAYESIETDQSAPAACGVTITLNPISGPPGTTVTVIGTGWRYPGDSVDMCSWPCESVPVDNNGNFTTNFTVPSNATLGENPITFDSPIFPPHYAVNFFDFTVTSPSSPPPAPTLQKPSNGVNLPSGQSIVFSWSGTGDAYYPEVWSISPVAGPAESPGWQIGTSWTSLPATNVGTTYGWHVKARNSAGESAWSTTWTFIIADSASPTATPTRTPTATTTPKPTNTPTVTKTPKPTNTPTKTTTPPTPTPPNPVPVPTPTPGPTPPSGVSCPPGVGLQPFEHSFWNFAAPETPVFGGTTTLQVTYDVTLNGTVCRDLVRYDFDGKGNVTGVSVQTPNGSIKIDQKGNLTTELLSYQRLNSYQYHILSSSPVIVEQEAKFHTDIATIPNVVSMSQDQGIDGIWRFKADPVKQTHEYLTAVGQFVAQIRIDQKEVVATAGFGALVLALISFIPVFALAAEPQAPPEIHTAAISSLNSDLELALGKGFIAVSTIGTLHISSTQVKPGDIVAFSGDGFTPNKTQFVTLRPISPASDTESIDATVKADSKGHIDGQITLPATMRGGKWAVAVIDSSRMYNQLKAFGQTGTLNLNYYLAAEIIQLPYRIDLPLLRR